MGKIMFSLTNSNTHPDGRYMKVELRDDHYSVLYEGSMTCEDYALAIGGVAYMPIEDMTVNLQSCGACRFHTELSRDTCKHCCKYYPDKFSPEASS